MSSSDRTTVRSPHPGRGAEVADDDFADQVAGVSALAEPARRALYLYVVASPDAVSRDQAATGTGVALHTAKFHLDRLVEEGLLRTEFRRLTGRTGPGAGRPAKLYRRSTRELTLTLPPREYELAGRILAEAVSDAARDDVPVLDAVREAAHRTGRALAAEDADASAPRPAGGDALATAAAALGRYGYEPAVDDGTLTLRNCPFHGLAEQQRALVCGMNLALVGGLLDGVCGTAVTARLDPAPGRCCVTAVRS
jgi:predicted ArsR family transcriptional regulator